MAQVVKLIDISRSYVPIDPNSFPEGMHSTGSEDAPEEHTPVVPYDGYNFMPTAFGYMSYFGINSILGVNALTKLTSPFDLLRVDDLFIVQTPDLLNIMVALCEDGIYTKYAGEAGAWTHAVTLTEPDAGAHKNYTKCVIGNEVYIYRAGESNIWVMRAAETFVPTALNPSSNLNIAAQQGIFKAGGRLGIWDSANSIAWSDVDDKMDFVPDLETGVGATIFQQIVGKIVIVIQHGNGFVIYCTRAIVHVRRGADANFFWLSETIFNDNGISYLGEVAQGQPDTTHFAYTTFGIVKIENGVSSYIIPEVFSYLKEKRQPVYLKLLEGRYLFFQFLDSNYLLGATTFSRENVPGTSFTFKGASYNIANISESPCKAVASADNQLQGAFLFDTYGYTVKTQATTPGQVPIWEDHLSLNVAIADLKAYKAVGSFEYFNNTGFTAGNIAKVDGTGNESFIPTKSVPLSADYSGSPILAPIDFSEPNTQDFYAKQDFAWLYEQHFFDDWKAAINRKTHASNSKSGAFDPALVPASETITFGPYIDLSFFSESNKYYGVSASRKSAWLQRSLTRLIYIDVPVTYETTIDTTIQARSGAYTPTLDVAVHDVIVTGNLTGAGLPIATKTITPPCGPNFTGLGNYSPTGLNPHIDAFYGPTSCIASIQFKRADTGAIAPLVPIIGPVGNIPSVIGTITQTFGTPVFRTTYVANCVYKNLGYTKISGHGHYTLAGAFVVDNATPEAADYTDQCDTPPLKQRTVFFNGVQIPPSIPQGCLAQSVEIDGETFTYPDQTITLPESSFLLQDGSIEPIYPIFVGAFVYDLQYKKWGKLGQNHMLLLNYSPINSQAGDAPIPADIFNVNAGCLLEDGTIALFDKYPTDSIIKWGKVGYFRKGFTNCEEVRIQFRNPATGAIMVEGSIDGKNLEPSIAQIQTYENVNVVQAFFKNSARWFNLVVTGIFDIKNIDFDGHKQGKR